MSSYLVQLRTETTVLVQAKDRAAALRRAEAVANGGLAIARTTAVQATKIRRPR